MMFDPEAKFYYPSELYRMVVRGFAVGFTVGASFVAAVVFFLR